MDVLATELIDFDSMMYDSHNELDYLYNALEIFCDMNDGKVVKANPSNLRTIDMYNDFIMRTSDNPYIVTGCMLESPDIRDTERINTVTFGIIDTVIQKSKDFIHAIIEKIKALFERFFPKEKRIRKSLEKLKTLSSKITELDGDKLKNKKMRKGVQFKDANDASAIACGVFNQYEKADAEIKKRTEKPVLDEKEYAKTLHYIQAAKDKFKRDANIDEFIILKQSLAQLGYSKKADIVSSIKSIESSLSFFKDFKECKDKINKDLTTMLSDIEKMMNHNADGQSKIKWASNAVRKRAELKMYAISTMAKRYLIFVSAAIQTCVACVKCSGAGNASGSNAKTSFADTINNLISENKIVEARSKIVSRLDQDRFKEPMDVAISLSRFNSSIYQSDDGSFDFKEQDDWDRVYWSKLRTNLNLNFSKKKLDHIVTVMYYLRKQGNKDFKPKSK